MIVVHRSSARAGRNSRSRPRQAFTARYGSWRDAARRIEGRQFAHGPRIVLRGGEARAIDSVLPVGNQVVQRSISAQRIGYIQAAPFTQRRRLALTMRRNPEDSLLTMSLRAVHSTAGHPAL